MEKILSYVTNGGQKVSSEKDANQIDEILKNAKFKIGQEVIYIACNQGDYSDQDKYYTSFGRIIRINVYNNKIFYDTSNHGNNICEEKIHLKNDLESAKLNHECYYSGILMPGDEVMVIKEKKNTRLNSTKYEIFKSELYLNDSNCYWYYNDINKPSTLYDEDFLFIK